MATSRYLKQTHVYKTQQSTDIYLDVYITPNVKESKTPKPVILWYHGGYMITGSRIAIPRWLLNYAISHEWTLVSPDYRVLPESTGLATTEDIISAYEWVANSLNSLHPECNADREQIIVAGASAGGWCTLVTALHFSTGSLQSKVPRPKALFLLYPMIDLGSKKWAHSVSLPDAEIDPETAENLLREYNVPGQIATEPSVGEDFPTSLEELQTRKRLPLLYAILEKGLFVDYLTGVPGFGEKVVSVGLENAVDQRLKGLFPLDFGAFDKSSFPATVIVHGTADREVSCDESEKLVAKLKQKDVQVQYFPVPEADHVFELELEECEIDGGDQDPSSILARALQAVRGYVNI